MSSFTSLLLIVACAALLNAGCEARKRSNRRNNNDAQITLGSVSGSDIVPLPVLQIRGHDVIIGFPDNCAANGKILQGTQVIVSNVHSGTPPVLTAVDINDPKSNLKIHCPVLIPFGSRCPGGLSVTSFQACAQDTASTLPV